ncbi:hypothetical protein PENDEC_c001G03694 [Penicillium decumbens]|uniref:Uncharacterized protein n=1 Tax=Penicillium decumbens TaxID=69771 RepID=A0A1V6PNU7_PENDC|nr:hypothetical protein PENDEC_c001G03694 [Penicillium decumbens]
MLPFGFVFPLPLPPGRLTTNNSIKKADLPKVFSTKAATVNAATMSDTADKASPAK